MRGLVGVEAASALLAMASGEDHAFEQWWGREARLAELAEHDFCDRVGGVEPHVVGEQERPHGMTAAEPHRGVDVVTAREALLVHSDRVQHVGHEQPVHHEPGRIADRDHRLSDRAAPVGREPVGLVAGGERAHDLDQLHERDRVEKVEPQETIGPSREGGELGDRKARRVRGQHGRAVRHRFQRRKSEAFI